VLRFLRALLTRGRDVPRPVWLVTAVLLGAGGAVAGTARYRAARARGGLRPRRDMERLLGLLLQPGRAHTPAVALLLVQTVVPPALLAEDQGAVDRARRLVGDAARVLDPERAYRVDDATVGVVLLRTDAAAAGELAIDLRTRADAVLEAAWAGRVSRPRARVGVAVADDAASAASLLLRARSALAAPFVG
jgi:hypothetical protein